MIPATELMVNNWVLYKDKPIKVKGVDERIIITYNEEGLRRAILHKLEDINPIPITEEILEKCGYKFDYELENIKVYIKNGKYVSLINDVLHFTMNRWPYQVKYLHEFQNLYFFLTKEHLEVR